MDGLLQWFAYVCTSVEPDPVVFNLQSEQARIHHGEKIYHGDTEDTERKT